MSPPRLGAYPTDPVAFIDDCLPRNEQGVPWRLQRHQRAILRAAFPFDAQGRLPWDTLVYSCPKKSGKTTLNAALTLWWAFTQEPPNELLIIANDLEQAQGRVFKACVGLVTHNGALTRSATMTAKALTLSNGSTITVLASEYAGAAGSNHGLTSWDELWGYTSEASRRLWEELTPVPTRRNSLRLVTTYAGWEGESQLLFDLYRLGVAADEHAEGKGTRAFSPFSQPGGRGRGARPRYIRIGPRARTHRQHKMERAARTLLRARMMRRTATTVCRGNGGLPMISGEPKTRGRRHT